MSARRIWANLAVYVVLLAGAAITLGPYALSLMTSVKTSQQFAREPALSWPGPVTGGNYLNLFGETYDFVAPIAVTLQMVVVILVGQLVCSVLAAYAFARVRFPGRELLFWLYLSTLMVPPVVTLIPLYAMLTTVGLRNTSGDWCCHSRSAHRTPSSCSANTSAEFRRISSAPRDWTAPARYG